jgi:hypothetical protein
MGSENKRQCRPGTATGFSTAGNRTVSMSGNPFEMANGMGGAISLQEFQISNFRSGRMPKSKLLAIWNSGFLNIES